MYVNQPAHGRIALLGNPSYCFCIPIRGLCTNGFCLTVFQTSKSLSARLFGKSPVLLFDHETKLWSRVSCCHTEGINITTEYAERVRPPDPPTFNAQRSTIQRSNRTLMHGYNDAPITSHAPFTGSPGPTNYDHRMITSVYPCWSCQDGF